MAFIAETKRRKEREERETLPLDYFYLRPGERDKTGIHTGLLTETIQQLLDKLK